jgi:hypothetical protein
MLLKLSGHISNCLELAANAERRALESTDAAVRHDNEMLAQSWHHLALSYQFVESLERFLADPARGKDVTVFPTELPLVAKEQPAQPESRPIIRRPRIKNEMSFKDRLMKSAQDARERAARLPPGPASERLLLKAMQSETAADIDAWAATPGSAPPKSLDQVKKPKH